MSYDFTIYAIPEPQEVAVYDRNLTSNVAPLWHVAFKSAGGFGDFADAISGPAKLTARTLNKMIDWIDTQPLGWVDQFDASNGWGKGSDAVDLLRDLHTACLRNPTGRVSVSR